MHPAHDGKKPAAGPLAVDDDCSGCHAAHAASEDVEALRRLPIALPPGADGVRGRANVTGRDLGSFVADAGRPATGTGAEVQRPAATVVIASSTARTLRVLPVLYRLCHRRDGARASA